MRLTNRFTVCWHFTGRLWFNGVEQFPCNIHKEYKSTETLVFNFPCTGLMRIEGASCWNENPLKGLPPVYYVEECSTKVIKEGLGNLDTTWEKLFSVYLPETNLEALGLITKYEKNTK